MHKFAPQLWQSSARALTVGLAVLLALPGMVGPAVAEVASAAYADPTTRYAHAVLGDDIEYGSLVMGLVDGRRIRVTLPESRVFEDIAPRLADLDGDGAPEVITIESSVTKGARLAIYGESGLIAATPFIGRSNRWLAPIGAADLDGDGAMEVAYIDRPHLARVLRVWRFEEGALQHVADLQGLTNHRIGQDYISGGIRNCSGDVEMITANADWSRIMAARLVDGRLIARDIAPFQGRKSLDAALACED